ncbi:MAG: hypothetical protein AMXMBFR84_12120 [Candidatus Hydrogenedentota bacterium]
MAIAALLIVGNFHYVFLYEPEYWFVEQANLEHVLVDHDSDLQEIRVRVSDLEGLLEATQGEYISNWKVRFLIMAASGIAIIVAVLAVIIRFRFEKRGTASAVMTRN